MNVADLKEEHDHATWAAAAGTFLAYGLILVAMTLVLFALPWLLFSLL
jgi:hypothetical protein